MEYDRKDNLKPPELIYPPPTLLQKTSTNYTMHPAFIGTLVALVIIIIYYIWEYYWFKTSDNRIKSKINVRIQSIAAINDDKKIYKIRSITRQDSGKGSYGVAIVIVDVYNEDLEKISEEIREYILDDTRNTGQYILL